MNKLANWQTDSPTARTFRGIDPTFSKKSLIEARYSLPKEDFALVARFWLRHCHDIA
jgi:hypothetical protein